MTRNLLSAALCLIAASGMAQKHVGAMKVMEPVRMDQSRAIDTIYPLSIDVPDAQFVQYGVQNNGGYLLGTNTYGDQAKAQQFILDGPAGATEILFWFGTKSAASGSSTSTISCNLYALNGPGSTTSSPDNTYQFAPGTVLASVVQNIADVDTGSTLTFHSAMFPNTVFVGTEFAAGVDFSTLASADSIALVSTTDGNVQFGEFCWEKWSDGDWYTLPAAGWGSGTFDVDACIFVVIDDEFVGVGENASMNNSRLSFLNGNISNGTVLLSYDVVEAGRMSLVVHNSNGQVVAEEAFGAQGVGNYNYTLSTEGWAAGNYYVTIKNNGRPLTKKMSVR